MGGAVPSGSAKMKRLIRGALRAMGPSPELLVEIQGLRDQVRADSARIDELVERVDSLASDTASLLAIRDGFSSTQVTVPQLTGNVGGLMDRVHIHEMEIRDIRRDLERFGGSVQDGMAVERRLQHIEDRLSSAGPPAPATGSPGGE